MLMLNRVAKRCQTCLINIITLGNWVENAVALCSRTDLASKCRRFIYRKLRKDCRHELLVSQTALRTTKLVSLCTIGEGEAQTRMITAWIEDQVR